MSTTDQSRRLVLASGFADDGLAEVINGHHWEPLYSIPARGDVDVHEYAWKIDGAHSFHCFYGARFPVQYCLVVGPRHDAMLFHISKELDFLDVDDLIEAFERASSPEEKTITTYALALGAGHTPEDDIFTRIRAALNDPHPLVRLAAINAAYVTGWLDVFRTDLETMAKTDPDPDARQLAANTLASSWSATQATSRRG